MKIYRIETDRTVFSFSPLHPAALTVESGSRVVFCTLDCFGGQLQREDQLLAGLDWSRINPATGPVAVSGANPGDTLVVDLLDIAVGDKGVMVSGPGIGYLGHRLREHRTKIVPIAQGAALYGRVKIPLRPMVGVIGVAPAEGDIPTGTPGYHGGNMDTRWITKGTRLYLPVSMPGAMLAMGDLHAVMGDGEVSVCGVEVPGEVTVGLNLIAGRREPWPVLETNDDWHLIASAEDLDAAATLAAEAALDFLGRRTDFSLNDAVSLLSIGTHLEISQVVDPLKTVRMRLPKSILGGLRF